jgi:hypothetical protein
MKTTITITLALISLTFSGTTYHKIKSTPSGDELLDSLSNLMIQNKILVEELNRMENHVNRMKEISGVKGKYSWKAKVLNPVDTKKILNSK